MKHSRCRSHSLSTAAVSNVAPASATAATLSSMNNNHLHMKNHPAATHHRLYLYLYLYPASASASPSASIRQYSTGTDTDTDGIKQQQQNERSHTTTTTTNTNTDNKLNETQRLRQRQDAATQPPPSLSTSTDASQSTAHIIDNTSNSNSNNNTAAGRTSAGNSENDDHTGTDTGTGAGAGTGTATDVDSDTDIWPSSSSTWSGQLNHCISHHPIQTVAALFTLEAASFALSHTVLVTALPPEYTFSSTWIVAYILSWPIRRSVIVKLTLAPFIAIPLANIIPALKRVDILNLLRNPIFMKLRGSSSDKQSSLSQSQSSDKSAAEETATSRMGWITRLITLFPRMLESFTRHYGLAAFVSYRLVGACILVLIYELLTHGVDVQKWLEYLGLDKYLGDVNVHSKSAVYVVSLIGCALLFPINIMVLPYTVKYLTNPIIRRSKGLIMKRR
jgi:hypothetical protein